MKAPLTVTAKYIITKAQFTEEEKGDYFSRTSVVRANALTEVSS